MRKEDAMWTERQRHQPSILGEPSAQPPQRRPTQRISLCSCHEYLKAAEIILLHWDSKGELKYGLSARSRLYAERYSGYHSPHTATPPCTRARTISAVMGCNARVPAP